VSSIPSPHKLILASASPRRKELLQQAGIEFEVRPADILEIRKPGEPPLEYALRLANEKASAVANKFPDHLVLGADTIVVVDNEVLGKPLDREDASRMLAMLSGRTHRVITAVSLAKYGVTGETQACATEVHFRKLEMGEIQEYIESGEPMDKAGAYAIQGGAAHWVTRLEGEYSNVVGLPMPLVAEMLSRFR